MVSPQAGCDDQTVMSNDAITNLRPAMKTRGAGRMGLPENRGSNAEDPNLLDHRARRARHAVPLRSRHHVFTQTLGGLAIVLSALLVAAPLRAVDPVLPRQLVVTVTQGDNAEHDILAPREIDITVRVTDEAQMPIQNAVVVFQLPQSGPGGSFLNDSRFSTVMSDEQGMASARGFKANSTVGEYAVIVTASYRDYQSVTLNVAQKNVDSSLIRKPGVPPVVTKKSGGGGKIIAIVALIGGAAAGAALGLSGGGGGGGGGTVTPSPTPTPAITITAGSPAVGAPR
jgi:hypothetical protein